MIKVEMSIDVYHKYYNLIYVSSFVNVCIIYNIVFNINVKKSTLINAITKITKVRITFFSH